MNRLIVKPMPHSTLTPKNCVQLASFGRAANPVFTSNQPLPNTPTALPPSKPRAMPSGSGASRSAGDIPFSDTPALANANIGNTRKATHGCSPCSSASAGEPPLASRIGMNSAVATPASVACTPDFSTHSHSTRPTRMYGSARVTLERLSIASTTRQAAAPPSIASDSCDV